MDTQIPLPSPFPLSAGKYWLVCTFNLLCQMPKGKIEGFCTRNYHTTAAACGVMPPCFWQDGKRLIHPSISNYILIPIAIAIDNNNMTSPSYWEI